MAITTDRKIELLGTVALFDGIGPDGLAAVAEQAEEVDFAAGRSIVRQGEIGTGFFLITGRPDPGGPRRRDAGRAGAG